MSKKRSRESIFGPKAKRVKRMSKKMINPMQPQGVYGLKASGYVDLASATYACNTTGSITLVATIAQGASVNQRIGKKVRFKSLQVRGLVAGDSTTVRTMATLILVYDRRPTSSLPAITDVLDSVSSRSFNNDDNSGRFQIVRRWDWIILSNSATTGQQNAKTAYIINEYVDLKKLPSVFKSAGTGAIGDIEQGALYAITVGDLAAGTNDANVIVGYRTRFIDTNG